MDCFRRALFLARASSSADPDSILHTGAPPAQDNETHTGNVTSAQHGNCQPDSVRVEQRLRSKRRMLSRSATQDKFYRLGACSNTVSLLIHRLFGELKRKEDTHPRTFFLGLTASAKLAGSRPCRYFSSAQRRYLLAELGRQRKGEHARGVSSVSQRLPYGF